MTVVAWLHGQDVSAQFTMSLMHMQQWETSHGRPFHQLPTFSPAQQLDTSRNNVCRDFLDRSDEEWLFFIDSDMTAPPWAIEQLVAAAHPQDRPVVGGLCFGIRTIGYHPDRAQPTYELFPTIYTWGTDGFRPINELPPPGGLVRCNATGAAALLIHRTVLERLRVEYGDNWFSEVPPVKEDQSFCLRLAQQDIPIYVHTGVELGHAKTLFLDRKMYEAQQAKPRQRWVVIPTKSNFTGLRDLIGELRKQGEADGIVVLDNGVSKPCRNWLASQADVTAVQMEGAGIHEMWNRGAEIARSHGPADIAFLNDDITIGPNFLTTLQAHLSDEVAVVCPNYDGRDITEPVYTLDICAGRYNGDGGIAGFAFMTNVFDHGYRFPENLMWWFGDNDLLMSVRQMGRTACIAPDVTCVHDEDGTTWQSPEMKAITDRDEARFMAKWNATRVPA